MCVSGVLGVMDLGPSSLWYLLFCLASLSNHGTKPGPSQDVGIHSTQWTWAWACLAWVLVPRVGDREERDLFPCCLGGEVDGLSTAFNTQHMP
jgi:hypothetical protein